MANVDVTDSVRQGCALDAVNILVFYINIYMSNRRCVDILPSALLLILTIMV